MGADNSDLYEALVVEANYPTNYPSGDCPSPASISAIFFFTKGVISTSPAINSKQVKHCFDKFRKVNLL